MKKVYYLQNVENRNDRIVKIDMTLNQIQEVYRDGYIIVAIKDKKEN